MSENERPSLRLFPSCSRAIRFQLSDEAVKAHESHGHTLIGSPETLINVVHDDEQRATWILATIGDDRRRSSWHRSPSLTICTRSRWVRGPIEVTGRILLKAFPSRGASSQDHVIAALGAGHGWASSDVAIDRELPPRGGGQREADSEALAIWTALLQYGGPTFDNGQSLRYRLAFNHHESPVRSHVVVDERISRTGVLSRLKAPREKK